MRIIDADELEKKMYHEAFEVDSELQMWNSGCWIRYKLFEKCLENTPTIDAADRPQGEWIEDPINKNIMYCSNCKVSYTKDFLRGMSLYHEPKDTPDFCPICGTRMK